MDYREYVINEFDSYWRNGRKHIRVLPVPHASFNSSIEVSFIEVKLPPWAKEFGVRGIILVPDWTIINEGNSIKENWECVDWFSVMFWMLNGILERSFEKKFGTIHSYSYKLKHVDERLWEYAWVNRIALFLRRWAVIFSGSEEEIIFEPLPKPEIWITHDLDAINKTTPIRIKQSAFHLFNFLKFIRNTNYMMAMKKLKQALRFFIRQDNYNHISALIELEVKYNIKSIFLLYGGAYKKIRSFKQWLIDPSYDLQKDEIKAELSELVKRDFKIGLHQSYNAFEDPVKMDLEKKYIEQSINQNIFYCRQHWLRFSWEKTWKAQQHAGLTLDMTLGFNDRPGFRNSSAIIFHPYCSEINHHLDIAAVPMVMMDSHLYDYQQLKQNTYENVIRKIIDEVYFVHGQASIIWHPHTLSEDYGWKIGIEKLLAIINEKKNKGETS